MRHQDTLGSTRTLARVGHWLLPWFSMLLLATAIAYAAQQALAGSLHEPPAAPELSLAASPGWRWVQVEVVAADDSLTRLACLTNAGHSSTDVLHIPEGRDEVIAELCSAVRPESTLGDGP